MRIFKRVVLVAGLVIVGLTVVIFATQDRTSRKSFADRAAAVDAAHPTPAYVVHPPEDRQSDPVPAPDPSPVRNDASIHAAGDTFAKRIIPHYIKNPASMDIPWDQWEVKNLMPGQKWVVSGTVRSTNSFNAVVPARWDVTVVDANGGTALRPVEMKLDGKVVWFLPGSTTAP